VPFRGHPTVLSFVQRILSSHHAREKPWAPSTFGTTDIQDIFFEQATYKNLVCHTSEIYILNCSVLLSSRLLSRHYQGQANDGKIYTGIWVFIILFYVWWRKHDNIYSVMKQGWGLAFYKILWKGTRMKVVYGGNVGVGGGMESERWFKRAIRYASELMR